MLLITAQPISNLRTPASADMNKRGFLKQASPPPLPNPPPLFNPSLTPTPYPFRRLLRRLFWLWLTLYLCLWFVVPKLSCVVASQLPLIPFSYLWFLKRQIKREDISVPRIVPFMLPSAVFFFLMTELPFEQRVCSP